MSQKIQEKKETQENKQQHDADNLFNKHIFNTLAYTFGGYAAGMGASLFFKRKAAIPLLSAGIGAGYGINNMLNDMNQLKKFQGQDSSSNTLKRDDQLGTKDWDKYQQKEESLQTQKPRYGGSDSDDSDNKSSGSMTSYEGTKKTSSKPQTETKSQSQSKGTDRHDTSKGGKSHEGVDPKKDQNQLFNLEGSAYNHRGDSSSKGSSTQSGSKGTSSHGKESESGKKDAHKDEKSKTSSSSGNNSHLMTGKDSHTKGGSPSSSSRPADIKGSTLGGEENLQKDKVGKHLSNDDTKVAGQSEQGTSRLNRRGGEQTKKVEEQLKERGTGSLPLQDKWGSSNKTGQKNQMSFPPEHVAGGEFRGKSTAGSQVNAVIE